MLADAALLCAAQTEFAQHDALDLNGGGSVYCGPTRNE